VIKNSAYWHRRFEVLEDSQNWNAARAVDDMQRSFNQAQREIDEQIRVWYSRFADNNQISFSEAQKWLTGRDLEEFKWDVNNYIQHGKANAGLLDPKWSKQLENASSRFHVSRLEALKVQTQNTMEKLFGNQVNATDNLMKETYLEGYYKTLFEVQKGFGVGWDIAGINENQIQKIMSKPWTVDGDTFSDRIWFQKDKLISEVHTQLMQDMILGRSPDVSIKAIATKFNTSKQNAGRLIMTESAYFASLAEKDVYQELDVGEYEILATLDRVTCELCGSMDGKVFGTGTFNVGVTAPPFHPWCRCTTVPFFDDDLSERAARDPETGKVQYVPADMKYPDWKKQFIVENPGKSSIIKSGLQRESTGITNIPMDEAKYKLIKAAFEKRGGAIISSSEIDEHLNKMGAEASTLNATTILMRQNLIPSASTMFEELIHTSQYRTGRVASSNWIDMEIEAKQKLIKYQKNYDIPDIENNVSIEQLKALLKMKEGD